MTGARTRRWGGRRGQVDADAEVAAVADAVSCDGGSAGTCRWGRRRDDETHGTGPDGPLVAPVAPEAGERCEKGLTDVSAALDGLPLAAPNQNSTLTAEQLERFVTEGCLVLKPTVPQGTHASIIKTADAVYEAAGYDGTQNSSPVGNNMLHLVPDLHKVFGSKEIDGALRDLLGDGYIVHPHHRPHQNDPGSKPQRLHKDSHAGFIVHRSHSPWLVIAMYYPQKVNLQNAPTSVCLGTQFYSGEECFDSRHLEGDEAKRRLEGWSSRETPMTCEAGTVVLLHNDIWHRGTANVSNTRRWMFCCMFMRAATPPVRMPAAELDSAQMLALRQGISSYVQSWMSGVAAATCKADVQVEAARLRGADDDQDRLAAAYALAFAQDHGAATAALVAALREGSEPIRRSAKFGASAACRQQLLMCGASEMVEALLLVIADAQEDPGSAACAARAIGEHGAWSAASEELRRRTVEVLSTVTSSVVMQQDQRRRPPKSGSLESRSSEVVTGSGAQRGVVANWREGRDFGFIRPAGGGQDLRVTSSAFGGGSLTQGQPVTFDVRHDRRSGERIAVNVAGPAVWHGGGQQISWRNASASCLEALPLVVLSVDDDCAPMVARVLAEVLGALSHRAHLIMGDPSRQSEGECLMFTALAAVRLIVKCRSPTPEVAPVEPFTSSTPSWWPQLRRGLLAVVSRTANLRQAPGARKPGSGGRPGADNGLRYALAYSLDALLRSGDEGSFMEAASILPELRQGLEAGHTPAKALLLRRCHLTTREHTF